MRAKFASVYFTIMRIYSKMHSSCSDMAEQAKAVESSAVPVLICSLSTVGMQKVFLLPLQRTHASVLICSLSTVCGDAQDFFASAPAHTCISFDLLLINCMWGCTRFFCFHSSTHMHQRCVRGGTLAHWGLL